MVLDKIREKRLLSPLLLLIVSSICAVFVFYNSPWPGTNHGRLAVYLAEIILIPIIGIAAYAVYTRSDDKAAQRVS